MAHSVQPFGSKKMPEKLNRKTGTKIFVSSRRILPTTRLFCPSELFRNPETNKVNIRQGTQPNVSYDNTPLPAPNKI